MFQIVKKTERAAVTLHHDRNVFQRALELKKDYCHVTGSPFGDYDISYVRNNDTVPLNIREIKKGTDIYPDYLFYDEEKADQLELSLLREHSVILFEELNEYSIVLGRLALRHAAADVWYSDERVYGFLEPSDRLHVTEDFSGFPEEEESSGVMRVVKGFVSGVLEGSFHRISTIPLFHSVFFWQDLAGKRMDSIRYVDMAVAPNVGIGGVLSYYTMARRLFAARGWETFLKKGGSRYPDEMLHRYFCFAVRPEEANGTNTLSIDDFTAVSVTYLCSKCTSEIDLSVLSDSFRKELEEYAEAVLGNHKVLGVLIRGTDYIASGMTGGRKMATVDDMLPTIREWIAEDGYDRLFLATEDQDVLDRMRKEFGTMLIAISQMRHRVSDFVQVKLLSELEKSEENYRETLEDNTVNYFYALFLLSRCRSLMVSGQCHGWTVAKSFNQGRYERTLKFQVGIDKH